MLPLEGVRILEFCSLIAGPLGPRILADHGAQVIKVESERRPDGFRAGGGFGGMTPEQLANRLCNFNAFNRSKLSASLDMTHPQAREIAYRLVRTSDVVIDNFSYGVMQKWGMGYEALRAIRPDIIVVSLKGLGSTGPQQGYVCLGPTIMAFSGLTHLWNFPDPPEPVGSQTAHPDYVVGGHVVVAILAALRHRQRTGRGQYIDVAMVETTAALLGPFYLDALVNGRDPQPRGNWSPRAAPHNCYRCADLPGGDESWCVVSVWNDSQWNAFRQAVGDPAWAAAPQFATMLRRIRHTAELDGHMEAWTRQHPAPEIVDILQAAGVPAGIVQSGKDLTNDPHLQARGFVAGVPHPEMTRAVFYPGLTISLTKTPGHLRRAPQWAEHNDYAYRELLGLTAEEVASLQQEGVLT